MSWPKTSRYQRPWIRPRRCRGHAHQQNWCGLPDVHKVDFRRRSSSLQPDGQRQPVGIAVRVWHELNCSRRRRDGSGITTISSSVGSALMMSRNALCSASMSMSVSFSSGAVAWSVGTHCFHALPNAFHTPNWREAQSSCQFAPAEIAERVVAIPDRGEVAARVLCWSSASSGTSSTRPSTPSRYLTSSFAAAALYAPVTARESSVPRDSGNRGSHVVVTDDLCGSRQAGTL